MKITSTIRKDQFTPKNRSQNGQFSGVRYSMIRLVGQVVNYFLQLTQKHAIATPAPTAEVCNSGYMAPTVPASRLRQADRHPVWYGGEPPDVPDVGVHDLLNSPILQQSLSPFLMNEQHLPNESPHLSTRRAVPDAAGGPVKKRSERAALFVVRQWLLLLADAVRSGLASRQDTTPRGLRGAVSLIALIVLWFGALPAFAQTGTIDLSLTKAISNQNPAIGDVVTYTVAVTNSASAAATATGVTVTDQIAAAGAIYVPGSATVSTGAFASATSASLVTGTWVIPSLAPGTTATLLFRATVMSRGVWFNTAEVTKADQTDIDSTPGNAAVAEDDFQAVCFALPIFFYEGDEYTVAVPGGFDRIEWTRNGVPISTSAVSASLATVNADNSLTIKSVGVYAFTTYANNCPSTNCCNIEMIPGQFGSLGDFVWEDKNADGKQDAGESGIVGVLVQLFDRDGTTLLASTTTAAGGLYSFTGLTDGGYIVKFGAPTGFTATLANVGDDTKDSDAGVGGVTGIYTIDVSQPISSTARNNPTVDAGFYKPASLGDKVFADNNGNGIQDFADGDTPIGGVTVTLLSGTTVVATTVTSTVSGTAFGCYSFTGLTPGVPYSVSFTAPEGLTATAQSAPGSTTANDSNANPVTGLTASITLASGENNTTIDAGYVSPKACIGDKVFADLNANGIQDAGEPGIAGVPVTLSLNGVLTSTTLTTGANGEYKFANLTPGASNTYVVGFTKPDGFTTTQALSGTDKTKDSDASIATGQSGPVSLTAGEYNNTIDAGYVPGFDVGIVKTVLSEKGSYLPGDPITYKLLIANNSAFPVYNVQVRDLLPAELSYVSGGGFVANGQSLSATLAGPLTASGTAGSTTSLTFTATISPTFTGTAITNVAIVTPFTSTSAGDYTPTDSNPQNNTSTVTVPLGNFACVGDYVFADLNANGIQDDGNTGINGVTVTLYINGSATSATLVTANGGPDNLPGYYKFGNLTPGASFSYSVGFTKPDGFTATQANVGDDTKDSDADPVTGLSTPVSLTSGEFNRTIDAGYVPGFDVGIFKSVVAEKGSYLPGEPITYNLAITNNSAFPVYNVVVRDLLPAELSYVSGGGFVANGQSLSATLAGPLTASGTAGSTTSLTFTATISPTFTGTAITNVAIVTPFTSVSSPDGYVPTDSNPQNNTSTVTVPIGTFACVGDYAFIDKNANGVQDAGDTGLNGVTATLYINGQPTSQTVLTANGGTGNLPGYYKFGNLTPGSSLSYSVGFSTPTGYTATQANVGPDDTIDSDAVNGLTQSVTLTNGEFNKTLDAGFYQPASLGDKVFADNNSNGIQDAGDTPIGGVTVTLLSGTTVVGTTTTSTVSGTAFGCYSFTGLTPGVPYSVSFTAPEGFSATTPLSGTDKSIDSDAVNGVTASVTLASGEYNPTIDAGFTKPTASLGDKVFADNNRNGIQELGTPGNPGIDTPIGGVIVTLISNGTVVATTTTASSGTALGCYSFTGLTPGQPYSVSFTAPAGFTGTIQTAGGDDTKDSDADPTTGLTRSVTLAAGENNLNLDAGFYRPTAGLGDKVFVDNNANGIQDADDPGIAGVTVSLLSSGSLVVSTTTDANGLYSFTGLTPGQPYSVSFTAPAGFSATLANIGDDAKDSDADPVTGLTGVYSLTAGEFNPTVDAGFFKPASLGDKVFADNNSNGIQDAGDTPIGGVTVTLLSGTTVVATTVTSTVSGTAFGCYSFTGLTPGVPYSVSFTAPEGLTATTPLSGTDKSVDSDVVNGVTASVTLASGENNTMIDAGYISPKACIGDKVFADLNANGIQDAGEPGIAGVTVTLSLNGVPTSTTLLTDANGEYKFANLTPGASNTYVVGFTSPTGFTTTQPLSGTDRTKDSDASIATGQSGPVSLTAGEYNNTIDAGYVPGFDVGIVKSVLSEKGSYLPGDAVTYNLMIANNSAYPVYNVQVRDLLPAELSFVSGAGFTASGQSLSASLAGPLTASGTAGSMTSLTFTATISPTFTGTAITNVAIVTPFTSVSSPDGYVPTDSNPQNNTSTVTVPIGTFACVGDYVFEDKNVNGIQDAGDVGINGVTVTLYLNGSATSTTLVTANGGVANLPGYYKFANLTPGSSLSYSVGFSTPTGFSATLANIGDDATDSDAVNGLTQSVTLTNGEFNKTLDAGFIKPASLGDYVFADNNSNGIQDAGDSPIQGALVQLFVNGVASTTLLTDASGLYCFTGLTPGSANLYSVSFTTPVGLTATTPLSGTDKALDSDAGADVATGRSQSVSLASGENNKTIDAGYISPKACIGDKVFADLNANGIQDDGEMGIAGVKVVLFLNGAVTSTTLTTGANGEYKFTDLTPGASNTYVVGFTKPDGFTTTQALSGTDKTKDSDASISTGQSGPVSLTAGEYNNTIDAGYVPNAPLIPMLAIAIVDPAVCNPATNIYTSTGVVSFTNIMAGTLTITNNGALIATIQVTAGQVSAPFSVTGISNGPVSSTLTATLGGGAVNLIKSTTYTVPMSCSVATCPTNYSLTVSFNSTSICNGESTTLTASTPLANAKINWYLTPFDGAPVATRNSGEAYVVNPTTTTVYYAETVTVINSVTCTSPRKPVVVEVTTVPTPICLGNIKNTCPKTTVDLTSIVIENKATGLAYEWYTSIDRSASTRVTNLTAVGAGKLYLFARNGVCYSNPTVLTVEIVDCNCLNVAGVNVGPGVESCATDAIPLKATLSGAATSVVWTSNGTGVFSSSVSATTTYTPSAADVASGSVMLTATTNDPDGAGVCQVATSSLIAKINKRPEAPVSVACDDTLVCQGSSTKLIGFAPGATINWYDQDNKLVGSTQSGGKLVVTPSKAGSIVYTAVAVGTGGCLSTPTPVTVVVGSCLADLAVVKTIVTGGPYAVGQKITYAITASNNGPITGTSVTVKDILPATLTFVSATPAAEYSVGTGTWTIGTLTTGSTRNLLVEATVTGSGTIKNSAKIDGPNNDPRYPMNDTSSVTINVPVCTVAAPHIACAITRICEGGSTTLVAQDCAGTVRWSDGQTGASVIVSPRATTTYTASCATGTSCVSGASNPITVTVGTPAAPVIVASSDNVCPGSSVTLTASGCEGGVIEWSIGQTGSSIVVAPANRTTYTAQCVVGSCPSKPATKTIGITTNIPTPTITCSSTVVCPGEEITLTVNGCVGTPVWNSTTATTASIVVRPTIGSNTYSVYCQSNGCRSATSPVYSISVVPASRPTVVASADSVCAGAPVSLTATGCNGTIVWNATDKNGNTLTGSVITVNPSASISYFAQCKYRACLSEPSNAIPVKVVNPQTPQISLTSGKNVVCSGEKVTLTAEGCDGTVKWYGIDRVGASISFFPTATAEYYATCKQGTCESDPSLKIRVTVTTSGTVNAPTVVASTTALCGSGVVSLTATGCTGGTITWSDGQTGPVVSVTATPTMNEFYAICTATSGTACGSSRSNTIKVKVTDVPTPTVVCSTDQICPGEEVTLNAKNCVGTPMWSTGETTTSIVVSPTVTTGYTLMCQDGICKSPLSLTYTITVTPVTPPTITASATSVTAGGSVTLTAAGCIGEVIWSANGVNGSNVGTSIVVMPTGTQTYYAQCRYRTCLSNPSATITINPGNCIAKAGTLAPVNATVCSGTAMVSMLAATSTGGIVQPAGYSVLYVLTKGADLVIQQTSTTPAFSVTNATGMYTIHTLVYNANVADPNFLDLSVVKPGLTTGADVIKLIAEKKICADLDAAGAKVTVTKVAPPTVSPVGHMTVCAGTVVTYTASGCEGGIVKWSNGDTGLSITKTIVADHWVMADCTIDGCTSDWSQNIDYIVATPGVPTISVDKPTACAGETITLTATGCTGGQYIWSDNKTVGSTLSFVIGSADVSYRVKCKVAACEGAFSAMTTIKAGSPNAPTTSVMGNGTATVTSTTACFGSPVTLVAQGCPAGSYVTWSNNQVGQTLTVSLATGEQYTARCCTSDNCKSAPSNTVSIAVLAKVAQPKVMDKTNVCPILTVDLTTAVTSQVTTQGGMFEFFSDAALKSKLTDTKVGTGTYYVVEKTMDGCMSLPTTIHVMITTCTEVTPCDPQNPATASAGADATVCAAKSYQLAGVIGGAGKTAHWSTSGTGTFSSPFAANATYTASAEDVLAGRVTLTLTSMSNNTACTTAKDEMVLTIDGVKSMPIVQVVGSTNLCYGDSVKLTAPAGATGYMWSNGARTASIFVKTSGSYTVQLMNAGGCSSVASEKVTVTVADPAAMPLVSNLRNSCPATVANLTSALSATTAGSTYEYRIGAPVWSKQISRPDSVGAGTYFVFERSAAGCVSAPAKVMVTIINCAADTISTDLAIEKMASTSVVTNGQPVTYTIKVTNKGTATARNIDVRDVLPAGLNLMTGGAMNYTVSNGTIMKRIDSLMAGTSDSIVFLARMTAKGAVTNMAEITYADQKDPNMANNKASVTVTNSTSAMPSMIGLAKGVMGTPTAMGDSLIKVSYRFVATNFGDDTLRKVQVVDDLAFFFVPNTIKSATVSLANGSTLKPSATYTGVGSTNLLDSASFIAPNQSQLFTLDVVVKRAAGNTAMSFNNVAVASAMNSVTMVEDMSTSGGDSDPDSDGNPGNNSQPTSFTLGATQPQGPGIGLALAVTSVKSDGDGTYLICYRATVKNLGDVDLAGITLINSLTSTFAAPVSYTVTKTQTGAGSPLVLNTTYDGSTVTNILDASSTLMAGQMDTVLIAVRVNVGTNNGPFFSSATATGTVTSTSQTVSDISNNGLDPVMEGATSTPVRFDLPSGLIGVAKSVGVPKEVSAGVFDIPYTIAVKNCGTVALTKVQVVDNLSETFGNGALIVSNVIAVSANGGLMANPNYTGQGMITSLLDETQSSLQPGEIRSLMFTVRVDVRNADVLTFNNTAKATAQMPDATVVEDQSTAGTNDDPDNDLDPRNNSAPTPISLNSVNATSSIGIAMVVRDTARQADGTFNVTYQVVVKNYGTETLRNVTISDTLSKVFNSLTGASFKVVSPPVSIATGSTLTLNPRFDGGTNPLLVLGDSNSRLTAGQTDSLLFVVNIATDGSTVTFLNSAYAEATGSTGKVRDISTSGLNPDLNGNGNPTDANEREATALNLPATSSALFIPEGFSPNGDGVNDLFVIRGTGSNTIGLEVYNRWGNLVYKNEDYRNDWDGRANTGIQINGDADGLPVGTYFYKINLSDGRQFVRYMTINR